MATATATTNGWKCLSVFVFVSGKYDNTYALLTAILMECAAKTPPPALTNLTRGAVAANKY